MKLRVTWCVAVVGALTIGCDDGRGGGRDTLTGDDTTALGALTLEAASLPAAPTNAHADDAAAASLGRALFFDKAMSADGTVACASCHDPDLGFSDPRPVSLGAFAGAGARHSMPATAIAFHPYLFWDGRADSAWSQPLKAIEGPKEMDFSRVEVTRFLAARYADAYTKVFGALPDLTGLPERGAPGTPEWATMSAAQQDQVNRAFSNAGKAIEAYERRLLCADTRFDRFVRGEVTLTAAESAGAATFVNGGCIGCHKGPSFSDGKFHDLGLDDGTDTGRVGGLALLLADPFNGAGAYSDDVAAGASRLATAAKENPVDRAFRTASLRGAGQRIAFGHLGEHARIDDFIQQTYDRGGRNRGRNGGDVDPLLDDVDPGNVDDMVAFLHTLDCPSLPPSLLAP